MEGVERVFEGVLCFAIFITSWVIDLKKLFTVEMKPCQVKPCQNYPISFFITLNNLIQMPVAQTGSLTAKPRCHIPFHVKLSSSTPNHKVKAYFSLALTTNCKVVIFTASISFPRQTQREHIFFLGALFLMSNMLESFHRKWLRPFKPDKDEDKRFCVHKGS